MFDKSVVELKNLVNKLNDFTCSCTQHSMETVRVEEEEDIDVIAVESHAVPVATGHEENKQGTTVAGGVRSEPGDGGGREDDDEDKTNKAAEECAAVTGHAENKQGPSAAGRDGGEADEQDRTSCQDLLLPAAPGLHLRKEVKMKKLLITKMLRSSFPIPIAH